MDFEQGFRTLTIQFVPLMIAIVFHEFAHGFMADRWGDPTARDHGRLTLNPIPHIDVMGTLVFPIVMMATGMGVLFGWAKPVPINPSRFRSYRPGLFWVSFAGPGMNFILAILSAAAFCAMSAFAPKDFVFFDPLMGMLLTSVTINYALAIFNLIPLPPLDGSKMVQSFLSMRATIKYEKLARFSLLFLVVLMMTGSLRFLSYPIIYFRDITLYGMASLFNLT